MTRQLDVVYVNYNSTAMLAASVDSVLRHGASVVGRVIVVDNASRDPSALDRLPDAVEVVRADRNLGFAAAANLGAERSECPFLLFLNPDTLVLPETLFAIAAALEEHEVVGPRQFTDETKRLTVSPLEAFAFPGQSAHCPFFTGETARTSLDHLRRRIEILDQPHPVDIGVLSGAALGVRRDVFEKLGGFDERFFLYWEDIDFCIRARAAGHSLRYLPAAGVVHWLEQSTNTDRALADRAMARGRRAFYVKHHPGVLRPLRASAARVLRRLPSHRRRWQEAQPASLREPFRCENGVAGRRHVVEIARTPLFDACVTTFPSGDVFTFPADLVSRMQVGSYFVRIATEMSPGVWKEKNLFRADREP